MQDVAGFVPSEHSVSSAEDKGKPPKQPYVLYGLTATIVLFVIVACILLFVLTHYYSKAGSCINNKEVWRKDDWYCAKQTDVVPRTRPTTNVFRRRITWQVASLDLTPLQPRSVSTILSRDQLVPV